MKSLELNNKIKRMKVLHISDIHFNYDYFESKVLKNKLLQYVDENDIRVDAIIITGDCTYKYGQTEESENFIKELRIKTKCKKSDVFICPGNHDVDRGNSKRNYVIDCVRKEKKHITTEVYRDLVANGYDSFCSFYKKVTGRRYKDFEVFERIIGENKYRIVSVNTCLLSKDNHDRGQLRVCCNKLESISSEIYNDEYINILIMHHGIEYFQEKDALRFQHWLDDNFIDIVMCGHSYRCSNYVYTETQSRIEQFLCGVTMLDDYTIPTFGVYDFNIKESCADIKLYTFEYGGWGVSNRQLRGFKNGEYQYKFYRLEKQT